MAKKDKKVDEGATPEVAKEPRYGMVFYTDGGARPNPGFGGAGIHGYYYLDEPPKKGSGCIDHIITANGYVPKATLGLSISAEGGQEREKAMRAMEITPIHYVDGYQSFFEVMTNNRSEMMACANAMRYAKDFKVDKILIITDSDYTRKGVMERWVDGWKRNGWLKSDLSVPANLNEWKAVMEIFDELRGRGIDVRIEWIKGHTEKMGNVQSDLAATAGVMASKTRMIGGNMNTTPADGYWRYSPERHPFLMHRRMYFNTNKEFIIPGEYYLGDHGKEDQYAGKRIADNGFAVVRLKERDPILELVRDHTASLAGSIDTIMQMRLDQVYVPVVHQTMTMYGPASVEQKSYQSLDLCWIDNKSTPLTHQFQPVMTAMRVVDSLSELVRKLNGYQFGATDLTVTDLTDILYERTLKPGKKDETTEIVSLRSEYGSGFATLKVDANYTVDGTVSSVPVSLTLGIDLLDRNALKRLEVKHPKVKLITWLESDEFFRYATIIEADGDIGIWAGVYSNTRVLRKEA